MNFCTGVNLTDNKTVALNEAIKADHGFHSESRAIRELVGIMSDFDALARRDFLQFITGSPKLPIGGVFHYISSQDWLTLCSKGSVVLTLHSLSFANHTNHHLWQMITCQV